MWPHIDKHPNHLQQSIQAMCSNDLLWYMPHFGERSIVRRTSSFWCLNQLVQPISWFSPSSWWFSWLCKSATGWWFGTFFIFHNIRIILPNWLSYFSEGLKPPTSILSSLYICIEYHIPIVYPTSINQLVLGCNGFSKPSIFVAVNSRRIASPLVRLRPAGRSVPGRGCRVGLRRAAWGADGTCYAWPACTRLISGKHPMIYRGLVHEYIYIYTVLAVPCSAVKPSNFVWFIQSIYGDFGFYIFQSSIWCCRISQPSRVQSMYIMIPPIFWGEKWSIPSVSTAPFSEILPHLFWGEIVQLLARGSGALVMKLLQLVT